MSDEDLKRYWYNRWKDGFSWLDMAGTLKTGADMIHEEFLKANQSFLQNFWSKSEVKREGDTIKVDCKANFLSLGDSKMGLYPMYMSQAGYALENLFKGIIITGMWLTNPCSIDDVDNFLTLKFPVKGSTTQTMPAKTHELNTLLGASDMCLRFKKEDRMILKKIEDFILWGGRYPIPLKFDTLDPIFMRVMAPFDEPEEHEAIEKIYLVAKQELSRLSALQRDQRP
jgi:hypothetical protein